jgi:hypothetical protein
VKSEVMCLLHALLTYLYSPFRGSDGHTRLLILPGFKFEGEYKYINNISLCKHREQKMNYNIKNQAEEHQDEIAERISNCYVTCTFHIKEI